MGELKENIEEIKYKQQEDVEKQEHRHDLNCNRLENKRNDMRRMMEAEIANYLKVIDARDDRITKLISTIGKVFTLMRYPRIMELIHRELSYDRHDFTWEEKLAEVKKKINLTAKEESEISDVGIILCPETLKEFYEHLRAAEREVKQAV